MKLTKKQVEMFKRDAENATYKHGYDMTIIDLCIDWLEMNMREKQRALGMITSEEATQFSKNSVRLGMIKPEEAIELTKNLMRFGKAVQDQIAPKRNKR